MAAYIVTYDLNKEIKRPKIVEEFDKTGFAKLSESSYAISTNETAEQVFKRFQKFIDDNDRLYVIPLRKPYSGFGLKEVNDWLDNHLPH